MSNCFSLTLVFAFPKDKFNQDDAKTLAKNMVSDLKIPDGCVVNQAMFISPLISRTEEDLLNENQSNTH